MKIIIWKELRENWKWALLAMACLSLAQLYALSSGRRFGDPYGGVTLCSSTFLMVTSFGSALAGIGLACLQILPELNRDRWAALVHRPARRETLFFGKALAGVLLCLAATLVPFFLSVAYVAIPGQFGAPLVPGLLRPGLSDAVCGLAFYFAAFLVCLHRGPWLGSRGAMALALVPLFVFHVTGSWPFLFPIAAAFLFFLAARGAFLTNHRLRDMPLSGRLACTTAIFFGAYVSLILAVWALQTALSKPSPRFAGFSNFVVDRDGKIFLVTYNADGSQLSLSDPNGQPVENAEDGNRHSEVRFLHGLPLLERWALEGGENVMQAYLRTMPRDGRNYVWSIDYRQSSEAWFLVVSENSFVGYDRLSRREAGLCDAGGFQLPGSTPAPFPYPIESGIWNVAPPFIYWSGPQLYRLDFSDRIMKPFFHAGSERIYSATPLRTSDWKLSLVAIALRDGVQLLDAEGNALGVIPYLKNSEWGSLSVAVNNAGDRIYLFYSPNFGMSDSTRKIFLQVSDLQGNILESFGHENGSGLARPSIPWTYNILPATRPPAVEAFVAVYRRFVPPPRPRFESATYPRPGFPGNADDLPRLCGVSLILALLAGFLGWRGDLPARSGLGWTLCVFAFGLPGFLTFLIAADWPRRVPCPDCRRKRPVEKDSCPGCRGIWSPPPPNGSEIFDPAPIRTAGT
jgi:hypothetical protein